MTFGILKTFFTHLLTKLRHIVFKKICINSEIAFKFSKNGELHRTNGPAIEYPTGEKYCYLNGEEMTEEEHRSITALYNWIKENDR